MRNGYFRLLCSENGTVLKIVAPKDEGKPVSSKEVMEYLTQHGVTYDTVQLSKDIQNAVPTGAPESAVMVNKANL